MKQRDYGLQDGGNGKEIKQSRPWQRAFLPGQKVEMSFIFRHEEGANDGGESTTCPGCQTPSENSTDTDVRCKKCSMWFRRITVEEEERSLPRFYFPQKGWRSGTGVELVPESKVLRGPKRTFSAELEDEDDVKEFKRVRLVSTKKRIKHNDSSSEGSRQDVPSTPATLCPPNLPVSVQAKLPHREERLV